jgi:hypothetical protein
MDQFDFDQKETIFLAVIKNNYYPQKFIGHIELILTIEQNKCKLPKLNL